ncbi:hypothetical protein ACP70R_026391 [Stipagrostis hirtigluma subsp. patula]
MAELLRSSIPSMVDGLTPDQRKILFCSFKKDFVKEVKVSQFAGYVAEKLAYRFGQEESFARTIVQMAQRFVGSNNINLMYPGGQFGSRNLGGEDSVDPSHLFTRLSPITRSIFPKDDDVLLNYLSKDGNQLNLPVSYVPIVPMVLVNGSEGTGNGFSTYVPNYNPRDIVANLRRLLNDGCTQPMHPWYRGFKDLLRRQAKNAAGVTYTVTGIIEAVDSSMLRITELPIRCWTKDYKEFLESLVPDRKNKDKETFNQDFRVQSGIEDVYIDILLSEENMDITNQEGLAKKFKLTTTIGTTNMHLFNSDGKIQKYDTPEQIKALLENMELDLKKLDNKVRFIRCIADGGTMVGYKKREELFLELQQKHFDPFPNKSEESPEATKGVQACDYENLLSMPIGSLTLEKIQQLVTEKAQIENEVVELRHSSPRSLWLSDPDALEKELDVLDQLDVKDAEYRKLGWNALTLAKLDLYEKRSIAAEPTIAKRAAPRKKPAKKANVTESFDEAENAKTGPQKKASKKESVPVSDNKEDCIPSLKDCLAAFNIDDSSPDRSATETETTEEQKGNNKTKEPCKRGAVKKASSSLAVIPDDEDLEDNFTLEQVSEVQNEKEVFVDQPPPDQPVATPAGRLRGVRKPSWKVKEQLEAKGAAQPRYVLRRKHGT